MPRSLGGLTLGYMIKKLNPSAVNKQDAGYYAAALKNIQMDAGKSLAHFQLPEEFSELSNNVANEWSIQRRPGSVVTVSIETDRAPEKVQAAVVEGVQYHWCHRFRCSYSASLLWRTSYEPLPSNVYAQSSSILYLRNPAEVGVRPVVFQNPIFQLASGLALGINVDQGQSIA